ncbi:hypothetical protein WJX72_005396 [[Myrmecia] bisecta]|uniref:AAA+ ATPase domain-containing protein n=1 Tax=[Myrmecia] bisecta TaxID=41462 RepID=A0AAW1R797_9CHLO
MDLLPVANPSLRSKQEHVARYKEFLGQKWPGTSLTEQLRRGVATLLLEMGFHLQETKQVKQLGFWKALDDSAAEEVRREYRTLIDRKWPGVGLEQQLCRAPSDWVENPIGVKRLHDGLKTATGDGAASNAAERVDGGAWPSAAQRGQAPQPAVQGRVLGRNSLGNGLMESQNGLPALLPQSCPARPSDMGALGGTLAGSPAPAVQDQGAGQAVRVASSQAEAVAAVAKLRSHRILAVHSESDGAGRDAHLWFRSRRADLLEDGGKTLIMHDCRKVVEALFYQLHVRPAAVVDTQVVHALLTHYHALAGEAVPEEGEQRVSLPTLLALHGLPAGRDHADVAEEVRSKPSLWAQRPLAARLQQYAASKVSSLLDLHEHLQARLQQAQLLPCIVLSNAHGQSLLDPCDRPGQQSAAYRAAVKLPINVDLEMTFMSLPGGRLTPNYAPFLRRNDVQPEGAASGREDAEAAAAEADTLHSICTCLPPHVRPHLLACLEPAVRLQLIKQLAGTCASEMGSTAALDGVAATSEPGQILDAGPWDEVAGRPLCQAERGMAGLGLPLPHRRPPGVARHAAPHQRHPRPHAGHRPHLPHRPPCARRGPADAGFAGQPACGARLGLPGVGKTTLLRDVTNLLADRFQRRVVVVDTSDEIGGAGEEAHPCIADARRIPVREGRAQYEVVLEATKNHTPEVLVVDEIGSAQEAAALKGIAQRGVIMVATAHGVSLQGLLKNPDLNSLVGGVGPVTLGDAEARASNRGVKTRLERKGAPVFCTLVEVTGYGELRVHTNVAASVDALLANQAPAVQHRRLMPDGRMVVRFETAALGGHAEGGDAQGPAESLVLAPWVKELLPLVQ